MAGDAVGRLVDSHIQGVGWGGLPQVVVMEPLEAGVGVELGTGQLVGRAPPQEGTPPTKQAGWLRGLGDGV